MTDTKESERAYGRRALETGETLRGVLALRVLRNVGNRAETAVRERRRRIAGARARSNRIFDALLDSRRRETLYYLDERRGESVEVDTVARHLRALEVDYSPETLVEAEYAAVRQELRDEHLPRLAADRIVDFDSGADAVRFRPPSHALAVVLRASKLLDRSA